ncbi:rhodanese-like domain-containing protein [Saccharopolyspora sp. 6M]|uniref:sulfurtransferase n=1 Tax=Saccharopolyspora sp. 6M TaxID=2877237 RepID=UPI001CD4CAAE|nr:rhodanese-like domain-containing protein [Saccharopolyspora sp. 6M]MCA1226584.1 sulfurtransferase [Saccharopolyspora sp. 6M]
MPDRGEVLVGAQQLAAELAARPDELFVADVTVAMASPRHDGDYRAESGRAGWERARIPGSAHLDLRTRFADPAAGFHFGRTSPAEVRAELARCGVGPGTSVVLHDDGRMQWAARAWWMLRGAGVRARVLDGGLPAWLRLPGAPVERGAPVREHAAAPAEPDAEPDAEPVPEAWADRDEVLAISTGARPGTLLCALSPEHFAGTVPTRYRRRGHIPNSRNLPAAGFLDADGTVAAPARLAERLGPALAGAAEPIVVYCGGGVSACLSALALTLDGYDSVRVYDGSLEEWTADPSLPVTRSGT